MALQEMMSLYQQRINQALIQHLPPATILPTRLHEAMHYAVLNGGKRVRPLLVYLTGKALNVNPDILDIPACAVECIHAYSLVHDDLPAMDDDDLRRGKPTCHKAFDEATAILAGDALQAHAFHLLTQDPSASLTPTQRLAMIETLSLASGSRGMVGGQMIDMEAVGNTLNVAELENMHIHKTGALIRASVKLGALASADFTENRFEQLDRYAKCIGLAFQIQDDILDVEASTETLGKKQGADNALNKPTYPSIVGLQGAKQMATDLVAQAIQALHDFDNQAEPLRELAEYIIKRAY
ncbi:(2E,6E)-farnesyl diphosphate synthase [Beggiatoa leptomitoformis]|uniref:(2E,6E)-farnesyl diphosphate synthase n=1 Tax=Beggiatoa leptomitoformis TaxID=288004 RepID=A0A2N9YBY0_9GAMM|nr:farnesyl diphosphate synthase [Beggiatoa leptomitoformis]ALG66716.1 (2E,6E)-farnesyl diphosphate synthase [Beggiatoa leptomitoformis]AUI67952.1 (2E,6E)-farnesyl diphosphate synthase [Beggiatoa leptomitoformis]